MPIKEWKEEVDEDIGGARLPRNLISLRAQHGEVVIRNKIDMQAFMFLNSIIHCWLAHWSTRAQYQRRYSDPSTLWGRTNPFAGCVRHEFLIDLNIYWRMVIIPHPMVEKELLHFGFPHCISYRYSLNRALAVLHQLQKANYPRPEGGRKKTYQGTPHHALAA